MHFESTTDNGIWIRHQGQESLWDVSVFDRTKLGKLDEAFRDINGYIATLPWDVQDRLWAVYSKLRQLVDDISATEKLLVLMIPHVAELYTLITFERLQMWMTVNGCISYPDNIRDEYDPDDPCRARTYLRDDYKGLVVLTALLRPMVPIFGEYIKIITIPKTGVGSNYKEYDAMGLLARSSVMTCPAISRLEEFIDAWVEQAQGLDSVIIKSGLSTVEIPEWIMGLVLVRRIAVGEIDANKIDPLTGKQQGNVITNIYSYINGILQSMEEKFGKVKDKRPTDRKEENEEESTLEGYKLKQAITAGDKETSEYYASNLLKMIHSIDPNVTPDTYNSVIGEYDQLCNADVHKHHITLCQWTLSKSLAPQAIECLSKPAMVNCMLATKALLLTWGYFDIALLSTAIAAPESAQDIDIPEPRGRMSPAVIEALTALYPYQTGGANVAKRTNVSSLAISKIIKMISSTRWLVTIPPGSTVDVSRKTTPKGVMYLPPKLSEDLGGLILHIGSINAAVR